MAKTFDTSMSWLFDVIGGSGELLKKKGNGKYRVDINLINDSVNSFTDRPQRTYQKISMKKWLNKWDNLFDSSNPNAALNYETQDGEQSTYVFEIHKPSFNKKRGKLSFNATQHKDQVIDGLKLGSDLTDHALKHSDPVIGEFQRSTLFVDTAGDPPTISKAKDGKMYRVLQAADGRGIGAYVLPANAPDQELTIHPNDAWSNSPGEGQTMTPIQDAVTDFRGTSPDGQSITAFLNTGVYNAEWTKYQGEEKISCTQINDITGCTTQAEAFSGWGWPRPDVKVPGVYGNTNPMFGIWGADDSSQPQPLRVEFRTMGQ